MKTIFTLFILSISIQLLNASCFRSDLQYGSVIVVNENGNVIKDAIMWRKYDNNDSFKISKRDPFERNDSFTSNTDQFGFFYSRGCFFGRLPILNYYRIQAKGYADLVIKNIQFFSNSSDRNVKCVKFIMYPKRFIQKRDALIELENYVLEEAIATSDTALYNFGNYTINLMNESRIQEISRKEAFGMKTYPNPAREYLQVDITDSLSKPYKAVLTDAFGKSVKELMITEASTKIDLQFEIAGLYILTVFNGEGDLKYCMRFVKQ